MISKQFIKTKMVKILKVSLVYNEKTKPENIPKGCPGLNPAGTFETIYLLLSKFIIFEFKMTFLLIL